MCGFQVNLPYRRHLESGMVLTTKQEENLFLKYYGVKMGWEYERIHILAAFQINQTEL